jgi:hypothetical protein
VCGTLQGGTHTSMRNLVWKYVENKENRRCIPLSLLHIDA